MSSPSLSARALREHLHQAEERAASEGRQLQEGAARVLRKLTAGSGRGYHRTYRRMGDDIAMWDLISDGDLARQGYIPASGDDCIAIAGNDPIRSDRILSWSSETEGGTELWIGERLKA